MVRSIFSPETDSFTCPPNDLPLEFSLDFNFKENPNHPALIYPTQDGKRLRSCTYRELVPAIHRTGQWISSAINFQQGSSSPPVVVVLLKTDTMTYLTVLAGLMRAGITAFPISPRFSSSVVAHLLRVSQPKAVIFNSKTQIAVNEVLEEYSKGRSDSPLLCELPSFSTLYPGHNAFKSLPLYERKPEDISIMTHSSSSSSLYPKVVLWSSCTILHHGRVKDFPAHQFAGEILGGFGLELFHGLGMSMFFTMVLQGLILGVMDPADHTSVLPADLNDMFRCFELTQPKYLLTNPRAIEHWAQDPKKVTALRDSLATLIFGGRFLSQSVGDMLVQNGVKLSCSYGGTEIGPITHLPHCLGADWQYWTVNPRSDVNFIPRGDGLYDLLVAPTEETNYTSILNATFDGRPAYNPGDLFIAHPTRAHTYKMFGRSSDQIMLATGEMVNPVVLESELSKHPLVSNAVMFGHSRFSVGILIERATMDSHNLNEETLSDNKIIDVIWPIIDAFNLKSPSPLLRSMIIFTNARKPFLVAPKGLPRRPVVWLEYQDEIDALYAKDLTMPK